MNSSQDPGGLAARGWCGAGANCLRWCGRRLAGDWLPGDGEINGRLFLARGNLSSFPRVRLADLPTPLHEAFSLREALGGAGACPRILIKRDDNTGLALGGNKARKLEFLMAEALLAGADTVITTGGPQSNHARMTAAAARRLGMQPVLLLAGKDPGERRGNLLLDVLLGADLEFIETHDDDLLNERLAQIAIEQERRGRRPCVIPLGGSTPVGALGYAVAMAEILDQADGLGARVDRVFVASGSGGTQAGLCVGALLFESRAQITGISVSRPRRDLAARVAEIAGGCARLLDLDHPFRAADIMVHDDYIGEGYAIPSPSGKEALELLARCEGVILDPVYTAKAMAGLIDLVRRGAFDPDETIVFVHTGGVPALFAE